MSYFMTSPFDMDVKIFHAFLGTSSLTKAGIKAAIKEALEVAFKAALKQTDEVIQKLMKSGEGLEMILKELGEQGWKLGDEITSEMMEIAIRNVDESLTGAFRQMDEGIERAMIETLEEGVINGAVSRTAIRRGIPSQAAGQADNIATRFGLTKVQTSGLRKVLEKQGFKAWSSSIRTANKQWFMGAMTRTFTIKNVVITGIVGGVGFVIYTVATEGIAGLLDLGEDAGLLPPGTAAAWRDFASKIKVFVVVIGLGIIGLVTFQIVSVFFGTTKAISKVTGSDDKEEETESEGD